MAEWNVSAVEKPLSTIVSVSQWRTPNSHLKRAVFVVGGGSRAGETDKYGGVPCC